MKSHDPWHLLRAGNVEAGLKPFIRNFKREPAASHIIELGVAYLWVRDYERARDLFDTSLTRYPRSVSQLYGMAGAAKWCLGDVREAVQAWTDGLRAEFADTLGLGVRLPLLLFVASVLKPQALQSSHVLQLLNEKAKDERIKAWPGPIALWLLGEISKQQVQESSAGGDEVDQHDRQWLTEFYDAIISYQAGNEAVFKKLMRKLANTSDPFWIDHDFFLARMWSEEFFIARHEAERP